MHIKLEDLDENAPQILFFAAFKIEYQNLMTPSS